MYNSIQKLASAVKNNLVAGLRGFHTNLSLSDELLELYVADERLKIITEYKVLNKLPLKDLYISINCIPVDCKSLDRCNCGAQSDDDELMAHFEIPQLFGDSIDYLGATDRLFPFLYYTSSTAIRNRKYRKRGKNKPYVWIDTTPNENGMYDCFVFNAPLLQSVSITAIFKDLRQIDKYSCCSDLLSDNFSFISNEIVKRLTEKLIRYYRQLAPQVLPNDQTYQPG